MKRWITLQVCAILLFTASNLSAQNVAINDDGSAPHASAMLDIKVTAAAKKGLLIPRMTSAQRAAIAAPAKGLLVYDSTNNTFWYHNGAAWTQLLPGGGYWSANGTNIYNNNTGNVGIGINIPKAKLHVAALKSVVFGADSLSSTSGQKFVWFASKAAIRFAMNDFTSTGWTPANIGINSIGVGDLTKASGPQSFAQGYAATASGFYSFAHGFAATASGDHAFAQGQNITSSGATSVVFGNSSAATGDNSLVVGYGNTATGYSSAAFGSSTNARTAYSFVIGRNNDSLVASSLTAWVATEPVFVVGNGASSASRANAFVILKNARTGIGMNPQPSSLTYGTLQVKAFSTADNITLVNAGNTHRWGLLASDPTSDLYFKFDGVSRSYIESTNGAYVQLSDRSVKKDIMPLSAVLSKVLSLTAYNYHYTDNNTTDPLTQGFIAQDVKSIFPDLVSRFNDGSGKELYGIDYLRFSVIAIKAIQEQQVMINEQKQKIEDLEKRLERLEQKEK